MAGSGLSGHIGKQLLRLLPDERHKTIDPGVCHHVSMVCKARHKIANEQAVMMTIDTVTTCYPISKIEIAGQVSQASIVKFVRGDVGV